MAILAVVLFAVGILVLFVGSLMFLFAAFEVGFLWALGCFLFFPAQLIFLILYWKEAKKSFFVQLAGGALIGLGFAFGAADLIAARSKDGPENNARQAAEAAPAPAPQPQAVYAPPPDLRTRKERMLGECGSELGMLCSGKRSEKAQLSCLRANMDSLRAPCREVIAEAR